MNLRSMFVLLSIFAGLGCTESVETLCEEAAEIQCDRCYSCSSDPGLAGPEVCQLADGTPRDGDDGCIATFIERCEYQSSTLEDPKADLQECVDSLNNLQCDAVLAASVQDRSITTPQCSYFL